MTSVQSCEVALGQTLTLRRTQPSLVYSQGLKITDRRSLFQSTHISP
jgi:hypothetical protein